MQDAMALHCCSGGMVAFLQLLTPPPPPRLPAAAALTAHFAGAALVFHLASYGMSGSQQLQARLIEAVNVGGTRAVLAAALTAGVERLVYLSTCQWAGGVGGRRWGG